MDGNEFNLTVRSLGNFFKTHKGVGLIVIDGMHFMEQTDFMSNYERKQAKNSIGGNQQAPKKISTVEAFAQQDDFDADNFL